MEQYTKLFDSPRIEKLAALFLVVASLFVMFQAVDSFRKLFDARPIFGTSITVEGKGKINAVPDIATVTFTVDEQAMTADDAQEKAAQKINGALALLKGDLAIPEADIKTLSYNIYPRYNQPRPCFESFCPEYEQRIIGYTASQTVEVKVRDTDKAGDVIARLGGSGISNLYGPNFTIDDMDSLRAKAREEAIKDAREKANTLARGLGVRLVRVTGFWENVGGYPVPYYGKAAGFGGDAVIEASVPDLPPGESEIEVTVSISYEIR